MVAYLQIVSRIGIAPGFRQPKTLLKDKPMRIALVSDIHGNLAALEAVAADIRRRGVDRVANLGDNVSDPLWPQETAQYLMASC